MRARTLGRDFRGWLASVVLGLYLKLEDWDSYQDDTLVAFSEFTRRAKRDVGAEINRAETKRPAG